MKLDPLILTKEELEAQREALRALRKREQQAHRREIWILEMLMLGAVIALAGIALWSAWR